MAGYLKLENILDTIKLLLVSVGKSLVSNWACCGFVVGLAAAAKRQSRIGPSEERIEQSKAQWTTSAEEVAEGVAEAVANLAVNSSKLSSWCGSWASTSAATLTLAEKVLVLVKAQRAGVWMRTTRG